MVCGRTTLESMWKQLIWSIWQILRGLEPDGIAAYPDPFLPG